MKNLEELRDEYNSKFILVGDERQSIWEWFISNFEVKREWDDKPNSITLEAIKEDITLMNKIDRVLIYSGEWQAYWRPGGKGYTTSEGEAGIYNMVEAYNKTSHCDSSKKITFIPLPEGTK